MNPLDKLLAVYLQPLWYSYCLGAFVQDKLSGSHMRTNGITDPTLNRWTIAPFALVAMPLILLYAFILPITLMQLLPMQYRNPLAFLYLITFIFICLYVAVRSKVLSRAFKKPRFLSF